MATTIETNTTRLSREVRIAQSVVLVDGLARTGKAIIAPIIASFERVEILRVEETLDLIATIYLMGHISQDAAVAMLRMKTDINLYNCMIGRDTNFRLGDYSGIWKSPNPWRHLRRLVSREGEFTIQAVNENKPIYQQTTHDQLGNFDLFFEAFGTEFRNVQTIRHPINLIDSWMRRNWGTRYGTDPLSFTICIRHQGQDLPFYAKGWEDAYLSATPVGRVIRMIEWVWDRNQHTYSSMNQTQQKQVFFIPFEEFVQRPFAYVEPLADFLSSATTRRTSKAVKRQKCPRTLRSDTAQKAQSLENQVSREEVSIMHRLVEEYESMVSECAR